MPTTPGGTPYETTSKSVAGELVYTTRPLSAPSNANTILYFHGSGGSGNQFATLPAWTGLRNALMDEGIQVIECLGGSATHWGNPESRTRYAAALDSTPHGDVVVLGRSMGALPALWFYLRSGRNFAGLLNVSGVSTMFLGDPSTVQWFSEPLWKAWGATSPSGAAAAIRAAEAAPEEWDVTWEGKSGLFLYGTNDTSVPWGSRGGKFLVDETESFTSFARVGGDHGATNGTYLNVSEMMEYLGTVFGFVPPTPVPTGPALRTREVYRLSGSRRVPLVWR